MPAAMIGWIALALSAGTLASVPENRCEISESEIAFGRIDSALSTSPQATGTIRVACHGNGESLDLAILLETGNRSPQLAGDGAPLAYLLYLDPDHQVRWGNGMDGGWPMRASLRADGVPISIRVHGSVEMDSKARSGRFVDVPHMRLKIVSHGNAAAESVFAGDRAARRSSVGTATVGSAPAPGSGLMRQLRGEKK